MIDHNGYPTEKTLERIQNFNPLNPLKEDTFKDVFEFVEYLCGNWVNGYPPEWNKETGCLQLSTGGWSGCESVIAALKATPFPSFWTLYWYQSRVGGHFWFKVRRIEK
jgi:hypothetical protein